MIRRSFDPKEMRKAMAPYPEINPSGFDCDDWLENKNNIMLEENGNVVLGTYDYPGVYTAHFFYKDRGREALDLAERMLSMAFNEYGAKALRGLTPVEYRGARWVNRRLGFKSYGILETDTGPHELFCLTQEEFFNKENKNGYEG